MPNTQIAVALDLASSSNVTKLHKTDAVIEGRAKADETGEPVETEVRGWVFVQKPESPPASD